MLYGRETNPSRTVEAIMSGKTGERCEVSGEYKCATHDSNRIPLAKGNIFPPCPMGGGHGTTWQLVRKI